MMEIAYRIVALKCRPEMRLWLRIEENIMKLSPDK
jgi:hypothetical protein